MFQKILFITTCVGVFILAVLGNIINAYAFWISILQTFFIACIGLIIYQIINFVIDYYKLKSIYTADEWQYIIDYNLLDIVMNYKIEKCDSLYEIELLKKSKMVRR